MVESSRSRILRSRMRLAGATLLRPPQAVQMRVEPRRQASRAARAFREAPISRRWGARPTGAANSAQRRAVALRPNSGQHRAVALRPRPEEGASAQALPPSVGQVLTAPPT